MMKQSDQAPNPIVPWSWWIWAIHGAFIYIFQYYMFTSGKPDWVKNSFSAFNLGVELSYAVWWSGICLFLGACLFYRAASACQSIRDSWYWIVLSVAMLCLCYDEIGSLHEMVSKTFGWQYLIPIGLVFIAGFMSALVALYRQPGLKLAAVLIFIGIALFGAVASLEFIEHNVELGPTESRKRLLTEESSELFAMSLIIIAGLISLKHLGIENRRLANVAGNLQTLVLHPAVVFALFVIQFVAIILFAATNPGSFSEGNPAAVFPILIYFVLFLIAIQNSRLITMETPTKLMWWGLALVFLFTSLCQIHGFTSLMLKNQIAFTWFIEPCAYWMTTLIPLGLLTVFLWYQGRLNIVKTGIDLVLLGIIMVLFYPDNYAPMVYELYSGCTGYVCYRLISGQLNSRI